jgi:hypothetical protein
LSEHEAMQRLHKAREALAKAKELREQSITATVHAERLEKEARTEVRRASER